MYQRYHSNECRQDLSRPNGRLNDSSDPWIYVNTQYNYDGHKQLNTDINSKKNHISNVSEDS